MESVYFEVHSSLVRSVTAFCFFNTINVLISTISTKHCHLFCVALPIENCIRRGPLINSLPFNHKCYAYSSFLADFVTLQSKLRHLCDVLSRLKGLMANPRLAKIVDEELDETKCN